MSSLAEATEAMPKRIASGPTTLAMQRLVSYLKPLSHVQGVKALIKKESSKTATTVGISNARASDEV